MFLVKFFKTLLVSGSKIYLGKQKVNMFHRKCGCPQDNLHNLISTSCPMYNTPNPMDHKFKVLPTPVKSRSDKKEYKLFYHLWVKTTYQ